MTMQITMASMTDRRAVLRASSLICSLATLLACGSEITTVDAASDTATSDTAASDTAASSSSASTNGSETTSTTDAETMGSDTGEGWPYCEPWEISTFGFYVGPNDPSVSSPDGKWPDGHHFATCRFADLSVVEVVLKGGGYWRSVVRLQDCEDGEGAPSPYSLDLLLTSAEGLALTLGSGQLVDVSFSMKQWAAFTYQSWYSLRDAETGELLLAAFADPGPSVMPKIPDEMPLADWLLPFEATLGDFVCPVDTGTFCEADPTPQRAAVHFAGDREAYDVVGGRIRDIGDYRVHLGFAGAPDVCEGILQRLPIHGVLFKRP